ncbi:glycoside hydrolase family 9 protein [Amycolatopsis sp. NPDC089917]|uniref:glycoside hydrolase family 9 protein n=1 Tax=Amycolatopsis sp. NPDC089917 TaxID=3155187 RepID=UPI003442494A
MMVSSWSRAVAAVSALVLGGLTVPAVSAAAAVRGEVRVDQVGYGITETKYAYLLSSAPGSFSVVDERGWTVHRGRTGASLGAWNAKYPAVYQLDLSKVWLPGKYRIVVSGETEATSPTFRIDTKDRLFTPLVRATNEFFQAQRDGDDIIPGRLGRKPSHLADKQATVYDWPVFVGEGGDEIAEPLKPIGGPIDVEGGWVDAGDFVKFTSNTAYSLAELGYVLREGYDPVLAKEVKLGLDWLDKMWDQKSKTLYAQVGIGTGSDKFGFLGDHDVWRNPHDDDALDVKPGDPEYFVKHRPVFPANPGGSALSPNLAGRVAAAFALGAQVEAKRNPALAKKYLSEAASVFEQAKTEDVGELVTAFPHAYYPESSWRDDMELGATQLALAGKALRDPRASEWTRQAAHWAKAYIDLEEKSTLNLYDTSALAHAELAKLLRHGVPGAALGREELIGDLRRQLDEGVASAAKSPFRTAVSVKDFDAASKSFGFAATERLYADVTGDRRYAAFGSQQRNFTLGANAWGVSLVVGVGTTSPKCPHHQAANLAGEAKVLYGAVVNGPNGAEHFADLPFPAGAKECTKPFDAFDTTESRYTDDLASWPSNEPAIDFTSTAMLAFSLAGRS